MRVRIYALPGRGGLSHVFSKSMLCPLNCCGTSLTGPSTMLGG